MLTLYKNIKKRRMQLNMSQQELAETVGYKGRSMISQIEAGTVDLPLSMIRKFADSLKCSPSYLMGWVENIDSYDPLLDTIATKDNPTELDKLIVKDYIELTTDNENERDLLKGYRCASPELREVMLNIARQALKKDSESLKEA